MNATYKKCCSCSCDARAICLQVLHQCLTKGGKYADAKLCTLLAECAQVCQLCADCCSTSSKQSPAVAEACAKICEETARVCDTMADSELAKCAQILRQCAKSCYELGAGSESPAKKVAY